MFAKHNRLRNSDGWPLHSTTVIIYLCATHFSPCSFAIHCGIAFICKGRCRFALFQSLDIHGSLTGAAAFFSDRFGRVQATKHQSTEVKSKIDDNNKKTA